jgi:hypothetical protein
LKITETRFFELIDPSVSVEDRWLPVTISRAQHNGQTTELELTVTWRRDISDLFSELLGYVPHVSVAPGDPRDHVFLLKFRSESDIVLVRLAADRFAKVLTT